MSLMSHGARGLAKASAAALVIAGVAGASAAQAAVPSVPDVNLDFTCKYPIVDKQPLSVRISSNIPSEAVVGVKQPPFQITVAASAKGDTSRAINTLNAFSIEGASEAFADLEFPDGFIQEDLFVPLTLDPWRRLGPEPVAGDLNLIARGETPSIQLEPVGDAIIRLDRISLNLVAKGQSGNIINVRKLTTDFDGNPVPADTTPDDFNVYCKLNAGQSNVIATIKVIPDDIVVDPGPPAKVTGLKATAKTTTTVDLAWDPATDPDAGDSIKEYKVYQGTTLVKTVPAPATSTQITGLTQDTQYSFTVAAIDSKGLETPRSDALVVKTDRPIPPNQPPTVPTALKAGAVTSSSVALSWTASTDDVKVAGYTIYRDGVKIGTSPTPTFSATGLVPGTQYSFTVEAFDEPGLASVKSAAVVVLITAPVMGVCPEGFACQGYTLAGSTTLKTLTTGVLPLKGGIDAQLDPSNGKFTADLVLNPTSGRLTAGGFLPVTVKIGFAPSGKTTGTLDDNNILRSKSLVRIKVSEVKLFGAIPLAGGNSCQTKSLSEINLTSTKAFEIFKGGTLTGTYAISDLNGCGVLNGIVSPLTAGGGNTISLNLTPKA